MNEKKANSQMTHNEIMDSVSGGRMITEIEAAKILTLHRQTLRVWRNKKINLAFYKIGGCIRYDENEVIAFRDACRIEVA